MQLALRGELGRAIGWLGRARRLVERTGCDRVRVGVPAAARGLPARGCSDLAGAAATAAGAAEIGERFGDRDRLFTPARFDGSRHVAATIARGVRA